MPITAFVAGLVMFAIGFLALPDSPASPEAIHASQALSAFFFGGAFIICGIFSRIHPRHGKSGIFLIAALGICTAITGLFPEMFNGENVTIPAVLLIVSLPLAIGSFRVWQKSRRFRPEDVT